MGKKFTKYEKWGDYHWRHYDKGTKYKHHADFIKRWVTEKKVLDVGAGDGLITSLVGAIGIDDELSGIKIAQEKGVDVRLGNAYKLEFGDDEFEAIMMIDVIEHFEFPEKALDEAKRVAPVLYIATPIKDIVPGKMDRYHYREWTPEGLVEFMKSQGYRLDDKIHKRSKTQYAKFTRI